MMFEVYFGLIIIALILVTSAIIGTIFNAQARTLLCILAFGIFAITALSSYDVTDTYVDSDNIPSQVILMEGYNADTAALLNFLACIISFVMFVVYLLFSIADYKVPKWKRRLEDHKRMLSN